jgi:hypothetical protein
MKFSVESRVFKGARLLVPRGIDRGEAGERAR